jgi:hypothetical protein
MKKIETSSFIEAYMITKGELEYVIDIFEELKVLADPSEFLEEEAEEAINILRSLKLEEIDMNDEVQQTEAGFDVEAYATVLFEMLTPDNDYAVGPEVLEYINEHPVSDADQEGVTVALKNLIDSAKGETPEEEVQEEQPNDEGQTEETSDAESAGDPAAA